MSAALPQKPTRRDVLRGLGIVALTVTPLSACAFGSSDSPSSSGPTGAVTPENPFGVAADAPLEVVIFKGGLGDEYATGLHEPMYKKEFPNAAIKHVPTQQIAQTLQPRFAGGDVPDVVANSGTDLMDTGVLQDAGQLLELTKLFDAPPIGGSGKLRDTLLPGTVESGLVGGKPYVLNYIFTAYGLWYDAELFKAKGWQPATTLEELDALLGKIKAAGLQPYAYPGKNAAYYQYWMILISAAKIAGNQVLLDIDNLKDGAWTAPAVKQAAEAWAAIGKKYLDPSFEGLTHTEVQTAQNQGRVGLYPCGSWLENEQKDQTPATFKYAVAATPSISASDKLPYGSIRAAAGEGYIVPAKAKNAPGGLEYLRIMLSREGARGFTEKTGNLTVVKGAADGLPLSPGNKSAAEAQAKAGDSGIITYSLFENWYKELETELRSQTNALMFGRITGEQFCANMQRKADAVKADPAVPKQNRAS
ncbi:N-acetylglucosamine/diacetylchitobiose ABC transporter substrate-binding protein [Actinokineospora sp. NBRC 105648]|uniref:N-acetylglucosamine/diacetylchitobiose ABC transporter substrate-binding protein n=1 Tax=Actinokineospora sp. NBRC 105648 TaxID=3032206 RepID=UPI0024A49540|nr:N-acetylglucosamine/diacetylchitobiose ABC transporter substrate-binding protein [Actinokineospora sp. NBRC 105648]GLZ43197.1 carbohydrate ABC transporter, N-acetylglucosamine/diacetylchitobiose-binding protein [Actinokineospora sp. NBRC 105648]